MPYRPGIDKPRVILAVDRPGWAFHNIASKIVQYSSSEFDFAIGLDTELRNEECDILIAFRWDKIASLRANNKIGRIVMALFDFVTWTRSSADLFAMQQTYKLVDFVAAGNQELVQWMRNRNLDDSPVFICEDGVDCSTFLIQPLPRQFTVGWCGNASHGHGTIKCLEIIKEACHIAKVPLVVSDTSGNVVIPHDQMGSWYAGISCYVCASTYEGTPNPPLEAMACGRPVVTTRVGIMPRAVVHGVNGFFAERNAESIAHHIRWLTELDVSRAGALARVAAEAHDWSHKLPAWKNLLYCAAASL